MPGLDELDAPTYTDFLAAGGRTARGVKPEGGRKEGLATKVLENLVPSVPSMLGGALSHLATLPSRALTAAGDLQRTGDVYDPGPAMETMMLGPGISLPKALLGKGVDPSSLAALYLKARGRPQTFDNLTSNQFEMVNDLGKSVGNMRTVYNPVNKDVHIEGIYSSLDSPLERGLATESNYGSHSLGAKDIRSLLTGIRKEFPEAETISGYRVSGAREAAGAIDKTQHTVGDLSANAQMRLPKIPEKQMRSYEIGLANQETERARLSKLNAEYQQMQARRAEEFLRRLEAERRGQNAP